MLLALPNASGEYPDSTRIVLCDFGFSYSWHNDGKHIQQKEIKGFKGNLLFASHNTFKRVTQSRRDDMISLAYQLVYLVNGGFDWMYEGNLSNVLAFEYIKNEKLIMTPERLCNNQSIKLLPFVKEVF